MRILVLLIAMMVAFAQPCSAQDAEPVESETTKDLAKESQNPIAAVVSLPLRNTINFNVSPEHNKIQNLFTIQPVFPVNLTDKWHMIFRTIIPILYQPVITPGTDREFGVSDISISAYISRSQSRTLIFGLGPALLLPTAMEKTLGTGKWSAGPAFALVAQPGNWVFGFLAQNLWSFAGYDDRASVNQMLLQTFVNYNLPKGWYLTTAPFVSANWKLPNSERWMVPAGGGFGKIVRMNGLTLDLQTQGFYFLQKPRSEAEWSMLFQLKFLFPKTTQEK